MRLMFRIDVGLLLLAFVSFSPSAHALSTVVSFESFSDSDVLTNQVSGLVFSHTTVLSAGFSLNEFEFPPRSGSNVSIDEGGAIAIQFSLPVFSVGGFFTYTRQLDVTAFDSSLNLVGSANALFSSNLALSGDPGSVPNEFIGLEVLGGISRVLITGDPQGSSFALDDLTFSTNVPEPGSLLWATTALILAAVLLRRPRRGGFKR